MLEILTYQSIIKENPKSARHTDVSINKRESYKYQSIKENPKSARDTNV